MPICPKCGKLLTSEQALTYHLNRKYKCGTWKCFKCDKVCKTKLDLQMHEIHCDVIANEPSFEALRKVYAHVPGIIMTSGSTILSMSPNTQKTFRLDENSLTSIEQLNSRDDIQIHPIDRSICILSKL